MTPESSRTQRCQATALFSKLLQTAPRATAALGLPSASSTPRTASSRLVRASKDDSDDPNRPEADTVLYLAYGSNMAAETFLGMRGIRPLSQVNVAVPALRLTFSLPGLPYQEPCFANVDYRSPSRKPELPDPTKPLPPLKPPGDGGFGGGLVGVVYEVTQEDYRTIIRTEGGGATYSQIAVPCIPLPPKFAIPERPPYPELPKPFFAKTLFAPYVPDAELPDDPRKDKWWYKFIIPARRPARDSAQASLRYLNLLRDGAKEHDLPDAYQAYLDGLQPYTITSLRQRIGQILYLAACAPLFLFFLILSRQLARADGTLPRWLALGMTILANVNWMAYDNIFKPLFGDGERTEGENKHTGRGSKDYHVLDVEKRGLLADW